MIELTAYGNKRLLPAEDLSREDRIYLNQIRFAEETGQPRFKIKEAAAGIYLTPLSYVGVIQLENIKINIRPRFDENFSKLIQLLSFCRQQDYGFFEVNTESVRGELSLLEIIIKLLLAEVKLIFKKGAFKEYTTREENLQVLRGRIDFKKQLTKNQLRKDKLYCRYDELDTDILENRILLRALKIARQICRDDSLQEEVNRYYNWLRKYCDLFRGNSIPEIKYHRLNSYYQLAHFYSGMIIENVGAADIYRGEQENCYSLLFNMNQIFEEFVAVLFKKYMSAEYKIKPQARITDAIVDENRNRYRDIKPDLYLEHKASGQVIVIDTKNKNYGSKKVKNSDIYQLAFYGLYFFDYFEDSGQIIIVYPEYERELNSENTLFLNSCRQRKKQPNIKIRGLVINEMLSLIKDKSRQEIKESLQEIIKDG